MAQNKYKIEQQLLISNNPRTSIGEHNVYAWVELPLDGFDEFDKSRTHAIELNVETNAVYRIMGNEGLCWRVVNRSCWRIETR